MAQKGQHGRDSGQGKESDNDLKEREYRDKDGNIHHHTRTYMEQHKGEKSSGKGGESQSGRGKR